MSEIVHFAFPAIALTLAVLAVVGSRNSRTVALVIVGLTALAVAALATAAMVKMARADEQPQFRFVWLMSDAKKDGAAVGAFAFPEHLTLAACRAWSARTDDGDWTPHEKAVGDYIGIRLDLLLAVDPVCLTDSETDALMGAIRYQLDPEDEHTEWEDV